MRPRSMRSRRRAHALPDRPTSRCSTPRSIERCRSAPRPTPSQRAWRDLRHSALRLPRPVSRRGRPSRFRVPRLVVCHLGGGCSVTAVLDGRSIDTTMGFTPLEGVPMGTRPAASTRALLLYLLRHGVAIDELEPALEHDSGLRGLAGTGDVAALLASTTPQRGWRSTSSPIASPRRSRPWQRRSAGSTRSSSPAGVGEHATPVRESIVDQLRFLGAFAVHVVAAREDVVAARAARALTAR